MPITTILVLIKIGGLRLNLTMEIYSKWFFSKKKKKKKDCYITSTLRYVDLTVDVKKLPQFDKIKEISDLSNAILADGVDFGYEKMLYKQRLMERAMHLKLTNKTK